MTEKKADKLMLSLKTDGSHIIAKGIQAEAAMHRVPLKGLVGEIWQTYLGYKRAG